MKFVEESFEFGRICRAKSCCGGASYGWSTSFFFEVLRVGPNVNGLASCFYLVVLFQLVSTLK